MHRIIVALAISAGLNIAAAGASSAQNLVITGARIITGTGSVIEKGTLVIKDGRIVSVGTGGGAAAAPKGVEVINGAGKTLIAGYIDDHRHIVGARGDRASIDNWLKAEAPTRMRELLESGVTTVQSGGDDTDAVLQLKKMIDSGQIKGPRIITSAWVMSGRLPDEAAVRAAVDQAHSAGVDSMAEIIFPMKSSPSPPTEDETRKMQAELDEAAKFNMPVQVHAVSPMAMDAAVKAGVKKLVHTPHFGWVTDEEAKAVAKAGAEVSSCVGFGSPVFDVFNHDNKPTFRDGKPWPQGVLDGQGQGREAGYKPVNGRTLFDNGVDYGYCTDTTYDAKAALAHELKTLNLVFSPIDLIKIMGQNSADFIDRGKDLGTIESGKLGDVLILGGNPLDGYWYFFNPVVVVKGGVIMVDNRGKSNSGKPIAPAS